MNDNSNNYSGVMNCEPCGKEISTEEATPVSTGTPIAKALGLQEWSGDGMPVVCNDCYQEGLNYIESGEFKENGYKAMPKHR